MKKPPQKAGARGGRGGGASDNAQKISVPRPDKAFGQHFLSRPDIAEKIVELAQLRGVEDVVEIGPGTGALTPLLCRGAATVTAIEADARVLPALRAATAEEANLRILHADALATPFPCGDFVAVSNVPYAISLPLMRQLLLAWPHLRRATLLLQKEFAQKIVTQQKNPALGAGVQCFFDVQLGPQVTRGAFSPPPKVQSQVLLLRAKTTPLLPTKPQKAMDFFRQLFASPRKKIKHAPLPKAALQAANIDVDLRAGQLSDEDMAALFDAFYSQSGKNLG